MSGAAGIGGAWQRFWFSPAPYFDLAVVRIVAVGLQCYLLLNGRLNHLVYVLGLPAELYDPVFAVRILTLSWDGPVPSASAVYAVYAMTLLVGGLALLGVATNASLVAFTFGSVFVHGFGYSFGDYHHPEAVMMIALAALALSPCGKVLSLDSWWRRRVKRRAAACLLDHVSPYAGWPLRLIQLFFVLMYLSAVVGKLGRSGLEWANGFTLQAIMIQDYYRHGSELALWLSQHHTVLYLAQWFVIAFQATFVLAVVYPRLRWIYVPLGLLLHIGIYMTLRAPFPQWIALYAVFIPWALAIRQLVEPRAGTPGPAPALGAGAASAVA